MEHAGVGLFGNSIIGILLFITHILGCITVGLLFKHWKKSVPAITTYNTSEYDTKLQPVNFHNLGETLSKGIQSAISSILTLGGFVVLFSVIISILNATHIIDIIGVIFLPIANFFDLPIDLYTSLFTGLLEITNGINLIANIKLKAISINIILTAFLLGFGGISVMLQSFSIISKSDLSVKPYIIGKILHGIFAAIYTFLIINAFPIFNFNLV